MKNIDLSSDFERFHFQMERIWKNVMSGSGSPPGYCTQAFAPPVDVYRRDDEVVVVMEVPGVRGTDVHVAFDGQRLTISGIREDHSAQDSRSTFRSRSATANSSAASHYPLRSTSIAPASPTRTASCASSSTKRPCPPDSGCVARRPSDA